MAQLKRILHPTDFSDAARQALDLAMELCARCDAELHLLHVLPDLAAIPLIPGGVVPPQLTDAQQRCRQEAAEMLVKLVPAEWAAEHPVHRATRQGPAFLGIIEYARDEDIDLIVLGTHGRSRLMQVLMGSVAERIVRKAPCPVLTVRPGDHSFVMP